MQHSKVKISKSKFQSTARIIFQEDGGTEHKVTMLGEVIQNISDIMYNVCLVIEKVFKLSDLLLMSQLLTL